MVEDTRAAGAAVPLEHLLPLDVASLLAYAKARLQLAPYEARVDVLRGVAQLRRNLRVLADEVEHRAKALPEGDLLRGEVLIGAEVAQRLMECAVGGDLVVARELSEKLAHMVLDMTDSLRRLRTARE